MFIAGEALTVFCSRVGITSAPYREARRLRASLSGSSQQFYDRSAQETSNTVHWKFSSYSKVFKHFNSDIQRDRNTVLLQSTPAQLASHCAIYREAQQAAASPQVSSQYLNSKCENAAILNKNKSKTGEIK